MRGLPLVIALLSALSASVPCAAQTATPSLGDLARRTMAAPTRHSIWRVARDGQTVAYLVGSIHVLTRASYPLPPLFDTVFSTTKVLLEEIDLGAAADPAVAQSVAAGAFLADGQTLKTLVDPTTYGRVAEKAAAAGLPMVLVDRMKPWLVAVTLMVPELQRAGFDPNNGLDRHFYDRAKADGRPIRGLETAASQLDRMNGLPMDDQAEMLRTSLDEVDAQVKQVTALVQSWRNGDVAALEQVLLKELQSSRALYDRLLVERNRNWVPQISQCQVTAPCMVVVGGAHLVGPDSVVAMLKARGFSVEQQ